MRLYLLDLGRILCSSNTLYGDGGAEMQPIPVFAVLLDLPQGKILYDTGCHPQAMQGYWPTKRAQLSQYVKNAGQGLEEQLHLCGIRPQEIQTVILSHMHFDHAGGLSLFSHADVYVPQEDFICGLLKVHLTSETENHGAYVKNDFEVSVKAYHLVTHDFFLTPEIEVITLPGHTPGLLGLVVHLKQEGVLIFPQDCLYTAANYGPPIKQAGIVADQERYLQSVEKIRMLEEKYKAQVIFGHDMEFFGRLKHAPAYYQ